MNIGQQTALERIVGFRIMNGVLTPNSLKKQKLICVTALFFQYF